MSKIYATIWNVFWGMQGWGLSPQHTGTRRSIASVLDPLGRNHSQ